MKKVGITGQYGFIGSHLFNKISLLKDEFILVPFEKDFFTSETALENWVKQCDVIVHLAALNRHSDSSVIHNTNIDLVQQLANALEKAGHTPHVLFSSSTQEERGNEYGRSKITGRKILEKWSVENGAVYTGMVMPNVFGPFGKPFYNSVVATFCYQLCNGGEPKIDVDGNLNLIYVDDLIEEIISAIRNGVNDSEYIIASTAEKKVSELMRLLNSYKVLYFDQGIFPEIKNSFESNLFNTFRSYINYKSHFPVKLKRHEDNRGAFVELAKLHQGGQVSYSTTHSGITRGNHFHTHKIERFLVIKGKALIQLRKYNTEEILEFYLDGDQPAYVDMPIWYTHNIKNIGNDELYTVFWINEIFDPNDPDTYMENV